MKINAQKKQYVSPEIEVFKVVVQKPLLTPISLKPQSNEGFPFSSPFPMFDDEEEEEEEE